MLEVEAKVWFARWFLVRGGDDEELAMKRSLLARSIFACLTRGWGAAEDSAEDLPYDVLFLDT